MNQPMVVCVCLTKDRPEMLRRAVACFKAQTYPRKRMLIWDTSHELERSHQVASGDVVHVFTDPRSGASIGALRNDANSFWAEYDLIAHFDDDDLSHSRRLEEQVQLLQKNSADVVGYSDMLFWREPRVSAGDTSGCALCGTMPCVCDGEAWLYLGPQKALGTSLLYRRQAWERTPFPDQPRPGFATGEESTWLKSQLLVTESSFVTARHPRMIASIHGGNTSGSYKLIGSAPESWRRVPEFDDYCRERMNL